MQRISFPDISKRPKSIGTVFEQSPLNIIHMLAHASEGVFLGFNKFAAALYAGSSLPVDLREIGILRAGFISGAMYETRHHISIATDIGLTKAQIAAIEAGGKHTGAFNDAQQAVLDFSDEFIFNVRVSDDVLAETKKHLTDEQLLDLMFVIGTYMMVSRIMETTGVPFDDQCLDNKGLQATVEVTSAL